MVDALHGGERVVGHLAILGLLDHVLREVAQVGGDHGGGVGDLVGDPVGELAQGGEPLRAQENLAGVDEGPGPLLHQGLQAQSQGGQIVGTVQEPEGARPADEPDRQEEPQVEDARQRCPRTGRCEVESQEQDEGEEGGGVQEGEGDAAAPGEEQVGRDERRARYGEEGEAESHGAPGKKGEVLGVARRGEKEDGEAGQKDEELDRVGRARHHPWPQSSA